jgi:hypothetical protein
MEIADTKRLLLRELRGKRSQVQLSRLLGFDFNQVYRWESGLTRIHWKDVTKICKVCKVDLKKILEESTGYFGPLSRTDKLVQHLIGTEKLTPLAKITNISRFVLASWVKGRSEPTLEGVLELMKNRDHLDLFIDTIASPESELRLGSEITSKKSGRQILYENPEAAAVLMALDLAAYKKLDRHDAIVLGSWVGLDKSEVQKILQKFESLGIVELRDGKYQRSQLGFASSRGDFKGEFKLRKYWIERGLQVDDARTGFDERDTFGFLIFPVDEKKRLRIREAYEEFANFVFNVAQEDQDDNDQLIAMTIQLFGLTKVLTPVKK